MRLLQTDCRGLFEIIRSLIVHLGRGVGDKVDWRVQIEGIMHSVGSALRSALRSSDGRHL